MIACRLAYLRRFNLRAFARKLGIEPRELPADRVRLRPPSSPRSTGAASLFVFPSLYEGAGLPILEAMTCGAPVAASGVSAMPELLGDMRATFDPADPADMARAIREALTDAALLDALRERSRRRVAFYTWERVAQLTLEGYRRAMEMPLDTSFARAADEVSRLLAPAG